MNKAKADYVLPQGYIFTPIANTLLSGTVNIKVGVITGTNPIQGVQILIDNNAFGSSITTPDLNGYYIASWDTTHFTNGVHRISAAVSDSAGNIANSSVVSTVVSNTSSVYPFITISSSSGTNLIGTSTITASVTPGSAPIKNVQFTLDGSNLGVAISATANNNYSYTWDTRTVSSTNHTISAVVTDTAGLTTTAPGLLVTVSNVLVAPTVSITAPLAGVTLPLTQNITATVIPGTNNITSVQFLWDGANLGSAVTTPTSGNVYSYSLATSNIASGSHTISAVATDVAGQTGTAAPITVTVYNNGPVIASVTPLFDTNVTSAISLTANVTAGSSAINSVQFNLNSTQICKLTTPTVSGGKNYSCTLDPKTLTNGVYAYSVVATDALGLTSTATGGNITINNNGNTGTTPPPSYTSGPAHADGALINANGTFYLIQSGKLVGVTDAGILTSHGYSFSDALPATTGDMGLSSAANLTPADGSLVETVGNPTVYLISSQERYPFVSAAVFNSLGYKFSSVLTVTAPELNVLPLTVALSDGQGKHLNGTDVSHNGTIYYLNGSGLHPYPSLEVYNSWHVANNFSNVVPANTADMALPISTTVVARAKVTS